MTSACDLGLLALRIGIGGTFIAHGTQTLCGWLAGPGLDVTAARFEQLGIRPRRVNALVAGLAEAGGGALLATGLATPAASATSAGTVVIASSTPTSPGFFTGDTVASFHATLGSSAAALCLAGPGTLSLDHALGHRFNRNWVRAVAFAAVVPAAKLVIAKRRYTLAMGLAESVDADAACRSVLPRPIHRREPSMFDRDPHPGSAGLTARMRSIR
ncbi:MAG: putative oxidoreductase [Pseudonocardiales bacterium]|jgi:putative oxidoreductase|nr:putative oxidoreductase [Pseudonocardiales bacterium]